jgi:hypothetical protein
LSAARVVASLLLPLAALAVGGCGGDGEERRWAEEVNELEQPLLEAFEKHLAFAEENATAAATPATTLQTIREPLRAARDDFAHLRAAAQRLPDASEEIAAANDDLARGFGLFVEGYDRYVESLEQGGDPLEFEGFEQFEQGQRVLSQVGRRISELSGGGGFDLGGGDDAEDEELASKLGAVREQTLVAQDADAAFIKTLSDNASRRAIERAALKARREWEELRGLVRREFRERPPGPLGQAIAKLDRVYSLFVDGYDDILLAIQTGRERVARRGLAKHDRAVEDLLETGRELTDALAASS